MMEVVMMAMEVEEVLEEEETVMITIENGNELSVTLTL